MKADSTTTGEYNKTPSGVPYTVNNRIRIVKPCAIVTSRKDAVLKNLDYLEVQIGRLAKMVKDTRAEVLELKAE